MKLKSEKRTVYYASDDKEFTNYQEALDYEFDISCPPSTSGLNAKELRKWLKANRNFVLDYIGTQYDPEAD